MNFSDFQKKLIWGVGALSIVCLWIAFPFIFKLLIEAYKFPKDFTDFGPFGDIYGSLNTLISSIALCAVAYSTYLQITSLNETRVTNKEQLRLAEKSHQEQLNESKHAVFSNTFNTLLNLKQDRYNGLKIRNKENGMEYISEEIFVSIALRFLWLIDNYIYKENWGRTEIGQKFDGYLVVLGGKERGFAEIRSYFTIYGDLIELIRRSEIDENSKIFYRNIVSNSMSVHEQFTLLWISVNTKACSDLVHNSGIFNHFYSDDLMPFLTTFFDKSCFSHPKIISNWDKYLNNQNPA
ncbi:hypothetical protein [Acinetobacter baumannii]|uniref:hypothetical protein n=1 Tax=Acinetobacter baumannii TaxID=470 RepID=UPI003891CBA8